MSAAFIPGGGGQMKCAGKYSLDETSWQQMLLQYRMRSAPKKKALRSDAAKRLLFPTHPGILQILYHYLHPYHTFIVRYSYVLGALTCCLNGKRSTR